MKPFVKRPLPLLALALTLLALLALPAPDAGAGERARARGATVPLFDFADLAEELRPMVVNIQVTQRVSHPMGSLRGAPDMPEFFRRFFGDQIPPPERQGQGSGVIIDPSGYIATNHHVVDGATEISVILFDGTKFQGEVVGSDPKTDLALVKISPAGKALKVATFGSSEKLRVGEWVMAIGNPFGLAETVTVGIISAKGRVIGAGPYDDFLQTDASINPGNSGGPLFNLNGEVVGINTAISAQGQGIGFAIPSDLANTILGQLREKGTVTRGWLGVGIQPVSEDLAASMGLKSTRGAIVTKVYPATPAEEAGLQPGDVILRFDEHEVKESQDLPKLVAGTNPGEQVELVVIRNGKKITVKPRIARLDEGGGGITPLPGSPPLPEDSVLPGYGLEAQPLTPALAQELGVNEKNGVVVSGVAVGSPAARAGLQRGDVILQAAGKPVATPEELADALRGAEQTRGVVLRVVRQGEAYLWTVIKPGGR